MNYLLGIYLLLFLILCLVIWNKDLKTKFYVPVKMLVSLCFLIILFYGEVKGTGSFWHYLIIPFILCFLGDFFMGLYNKRRVKRDLILGIVAFAGAHVAFLINMYYFALSFSWWIIIFPIATIISLALLLNFSHSFHVGKLLVPVLIYALFIGTLLGKGIEIWILQNCPSPYLFGIGSLLFFISDFSLVYLYFYHFKKREHEKYVHFINLLTYYGAIIVLILAFLGY